MKTFLGFVVKEFYHILRDQRTLVILFGMPIAQMVLFGFAIRNEIDNVEIAVVDLSHDRATADLTDRLDATSLFHVTQFESVDAVEGAFRRGSIRLAAIFEPRFEQRLERERLASIQIITDASNPNTANTVLAYASAIVTAYQDERLQEGSGDVRIVPEVRMRFNPELRSVVLFVPGLIALILMLVCALMTSITITREKETGTMEILLVSPLRPQQIIIGKVLPYLALSMVNVVTVLVLARYVFDVPVQGNLPLLLAECLLFTVCALSLGILISSRTSSQQTAMMIALAGLLMPTVLLSGFIFPVSSMPEVLQYVSHIVPAKWFLIIIRGLMIKGVGLDVFWKETLVLVGMTALFLGVGARSFNVRLQ